MNLPPLIKILIPATLLATVSCVISLVFSRWLLYLLPKFGMIDKPDHARHIHAVAVPRGGGIGMMAAFVITCLGYTILYNKDEGTLLTLKQLRILTPLAILVPLGIIDDKITLKARTKFFFQALAALLAWTLGVRMGFIFGFELPQWLSCLLTVFWITAMINAFNMIDGIDGLASGVGCISAISIAIIAISNDLLWEASLLFVFGGALLGFLKYNHHPAKMFMGDTGSMFIGYILGVSGIVVSARLASVFSIFIPLLACGVPFLDIFLAVWRRLTTSAPPKEQESAAYEEEQEPQKKHPDTFFWRSITLLGRLGRADRRHIHHRLMERYGNNQRKTVHSIYWLAIALGLISLLCLQIDQHSVLLAFAIIILTFSFVISRLANVEMWNSADILYHNFSQPHAGFILSVVISPIIDLILIAISYSIAAESYVFISILFRHIACVGIVLAFSRNYHTFWNLPSSDDYFRLMLSITFGCLLAFIVDLLFKTPFHGKNHLYAAALINASIIGERLFIHFFRNYMVKKHTTDKMSENTQIRNVAILGVTPEARLYRNKLNTDFTGQYQENLLGLICYDHRFRSGYCYGMKVLGDLDDLREVHKKLIVAKIVITTKLEDNDKHKLIEFATANNIELVNLQTTPTPFA